MRVQHPAIRAGLWLLLVFTLVAFGVYLLAGSRWAFGLALQQAKNAGFDVSGAQISGNLLTGVKVEGLRLKSKLVSASAKSATLHWKPWALLRGEVRVSGEVDTGRVVLDLSQLPQPDPNAPAPPLRFVLENIALAKTRLEVDGRVFGLPVLDVGIETLQRLPSNDGDLRVQTRLRVRSPDGTALVSGRAKLAASGALWFEATLDGEARMARHWYKDIRGGRVKAAYQMTPKGLAGTFKVLDGELEPVPGVLVKGVNGTGTHSRDNVIRAQLTARGLGGPVRAQVVVDTPRQRWNVNGELEPDAASAATAFGVQIAARGRVFVTANGGGWEDFKLGGIFRSKDAQALGLRLSGLQGDWSLRGPNDLSVKINSKTRTWLLGGQNPNNQADITANATVTPTRTLVQSKIVGRFLGEVLGVAGKATIRGETIQLEANGKALSASVAANGNIKNQTLEAAATLTGLHLPKNLAPSIAAQGDATLQAKGALTNLGVRAAFSRLRLDVPGIKNKDFPGVVTARLQNGTLQNIRANLGVLALQGDLGAGKIQASAVRIDPAGLASFDGRYRQVNEAYQLEGDLRGTNLDFSGARFDDLRGPVALRLAPQLLATWRTQKASFKLSAQDLAVEARGLGLQYQGQGFAIAGDASLRFSDLGVRGQLTATGDLGRVVARGNGTPSIALGGDVRYQGLRAKLVGTARLQPSFALNATGSIAGQGSVPLSGRVVVKTNAGQAPTLEVDVLSGRERVRLDLQNGLRATGRVDVRALDALLPENLRGALSGNAVVDWRDNQGRAELNANFQGVPIVGNASSTNGVTNVALKVPTESKAALGGLPLGGLRLLGQVAPRIDVRAEYQGLRLQARGSSNDVVVRLEGTAPRLTLLEPVYGLGLRGKTNLTGRVRNGAVFASGQALGVAVQNLSYQNGVLRGQTGPFAVVASGQRVRTSGLGFVLQGQTLDFKSAALQTQIGDVLLQAAQSSGQVSLAQPLLVRAKASATGQVLRGGARFAGPLQLELAPTGDTWRGTLQTKLRGAGVDVLASGPWENLVVAGQMPSTVLAALGRVTLPDFLATRVTVRGRVSLPQAEYALSANADLGNSASRLKAALDVRGKAANVVVRGDFKNPTGGNATLLLRGANNLELTANNFDLAWLGVASGLTGEVRAVGPALRGNLHGTVLGQNSTLGWTGAGFVAKVDAPIRLEASAPRWNWPLDVAPIRLRGVGANNLPLNLSGTLQLGAKTQALGRLRFAGMQSSIGDEVVKLLPVDWAWRFSLANGLQIRVGPNATTKTTGSAEAKPRRTTASNNQKKPKHNALEGTLAQKNSAQDTLIFNNVWSGTLRLPYEAWGGRGDVRVLALGGPINNPRMRLLSSGPIAVRGAGTLQGLNVVAQTALQPFIKKLPTQIAQTVTPGALRVSFSLAVLPKVKVSSKAVLLGSQLGQDNADLQVRAGWTDGGAWQAQGNLRLGTSVSGVVVSPKGLFAPNLNLDLRLLRLVGINAKGKASGRLALPGFDLAQAEVLLGLDANVEGVSAIGSLQSKGQTLELDLGGLVASQRYALRGPVYPYANAALSLRALQGTLQGDVVGERDLHLVLAGPWNGQNMALEARLFGEALSVEASNEVGQVLLSGTFNENNLGAAQDWLALDGRFGVSEVAAFVGARGNLAGELSVRNTHVVAKNLVGKLEDFDIAGQAEWLNNQVVVNAQATSDEASLQATGQLWPKLQVALDGESRLAYAPGKLQGDLGGDFAAPRANLKGLLGTARYGLIAPNTTLDARLVGQDWRVLLDGAALSGELRGDFSGLVAARLRLDAKLQNGNETLPVVGNLQWGKETGFVGGIKSNGALFGSAFVLDAVGNQDLNLELVWRGGRVVAALPGDLQHLGGNFGIADFDVGALWQRPGELRLSARGEVAASNGLNVRLQGELHDASEALSGPFGLQYGPNGGHADFASTALRLAATLTNGASNLQGNGISLMGRFVRAPLQRFLPKDLASTLELSGAIEARFATQDDAPSNNQTWDVRLNNIVLDGETRYGRVALRGEANATPSRLHSKLEAQVLGGTLRVGGALGWSATQNAAGVEVTATGLNLETLGLQGKVAGQLQLLGEARDPGLRGSLTLEKLAGFRSDWFADGAVVLGERLLSPSLDGTLRLGGTASGALRLKLNDPFGVPTLALDGEVKRAGAGASLALAGAWPKLRGTATLAWPNLPKLDLFGYGDARYGVQVAGRQSGVVGLQDNPENPYSPWLTGALDLDVGVSELLSGASGRITSRVNLSGELLAPRLQSEGGWQNLSLAGAQLEDAALTGRYDAAGLKAGALGVSGGTLALREDGTLALAGLKAKVAGLESSVSGGGVWNDLQLQAEVQGWANGKVLARYRDGTLELDPQAQIGDVRVLGPLRLNPETGWSGGVRVLGLPSAAPLASTNQNTNEKPSGLAGNAPQDAPETNADNTWRLQASGAPANLQLVGDGVAFGAGFGVSFAANPLRVSLLAKNTSTDAPKEASGTQASGTLNLNGDKLSGDLRYQTLWNGKPVALGLALLGTVQEPQVRLQATLAKLNATFAGGLGAGGLASSLRLFGNLEVEDGENTSRFVLQNERLVGNGRLRLAALEQEGITGVVNLESNIAGLDLAAFKPQGFLDLNWNDLKSPLALPFVDNTLDGSGRLRYEQIGTTQQVVFDVAGSYGQLSGNLQNAGRFWQGQTQINLLGAGRKGKLSGVLQRQENGFDGTLTTEDFALRFGERPAVLRGEIALKNSSFTIDASTESLGGRLGLSGDGHLSDVLPSLEWLFGPSDNQGYGLKASLDDVKLEDLSPLRQALPFATGRVRGVAVISSSVTYFELLAPQLALPAPTTKPNSPPVRLSLSLKGTYSDGSLRYNGSIKDSTSVRLGGVSNTTGDLSETRFGTSEISGTLIGDEVSGSLVLKSAAISSWLAALTGPLPGEANATGIVNYEFPIRDPLKGSLRLALERVNFASGNESLSGSAALSYNAGRFELEHLDIRGAGTWQGRGHYRPDSVDLALRFSNTTFTPVLSIVPFLRDFAPSASGSLALKLGGKYGQPDVRLDLKDFKGKISGIGLASSELIGSVENGRLRVAGKVQTSDNLDGELQLGVTGVVSSFSPVKLEDLNAKAVGALRINPIGLIENVQAEVIGSSGGFAFKATGLKGEGPLKVEGQLSPSVKLRLTGQNLGLVIPQYLLRDGVVDLPDRAGEGLSFESDGPGRYVVRGAINIARMNVDSSINREQGQAVATSNAVVPVASARNRLFERIRFDAVRVNAPNNVRLQEKNTNLYVEVGGVLSLGGSMATPELLGELNALPRSRDASILSTKLLEDARLNVVDHGSFSLLGRRYMVASATARFDPINGILPLVNATGYTEVKAKLQCGNNTNDVDMLLALGIQIRFRKLEGGGFRIEPETAPKPITPTGCTEPDAQQLYRLIGLGDATGNALDLSRGALNTALNIFVFSELNRTLSEATGLDFRVDTNFIDFLLDRANSTNTQRELNVAFTIGRAITPQLYLETKFATDGNLSLSLTANSEDNRFSLRFFAPLKLDFSNGRLVLFSSELGLLYNFSSATSVSLGLQYQSSENAQSFGVKLGLVLRL